MPVFSKQMVAKKLSKTRNNHPNKRDQEQVRTRKKGRKKKKSKKILQSKRLLLYLSPKTSSKKS